MYVKPVDKQDAVYGGHAFLKRSGTVYATSKSTDFKLIEYNTAKISRKTVSTVVGTTTGGLNSLLNSRALVKVPAAIVSSLV